MNWNSIEVIALLFIFLGVIKVLCILYNRKEWHRFIEKFYHHAKISASILIILAIVVLFYLLQSMSIVQIMAVLAFASLLFGLGFLEFKKETLEFATTILKKKVSNMEIVYIVVWCLLMLWAFINIIL